jgi:hypothetical protein
MFFGIFLIVFAARLAMVLIFAPEMPYYDEWDGVIEGMARPLSSGNFSFGFFFQPHNEHLLFWTKLFSYIALRAGDLQFDNVPVCEINQLLYAFIVAGLITLAAKNLGAFRWWFVVATVLIAALPFGGETIGMGWGDPYYFLVGFSAATIILASGLRGSIAACVALALASFAAGISMASGVLVGAAALLAVTMRLRSGDLSIAAAARMASAIFIAMLLTVLFAISANRATLGWGVVQSAELALLIALWFPTWLLSIRIWHRTANNVDIAFVCVAVWGLMQIGAILLGRPTFRLWYPVPRYVEIFGAGLFANLGCLCRLAMVDKHRKIWTMLSRAAAIVVVVTAIVSLPIAWQWTRQRAADEHEQEQRVTRYIHDGDRSAIDGAPIEKLPYPLRERLQMWIDAPDVRLILGDRIGTRPTPSPFVEKVRGFNAMLIDGTGWLLPLTLGSGMLLLVRSRGE